MINQAMKIFGSPLQMKMSIRSFYINYDDKRIFETEIENRIIMSVDLDSKYLHFEFNPCDSGVSSTLHSQL